MNALNMPVDTLRCEMSEDCTAVVEMIGEKGYVYCAGHGIIRRAHGYERTRKLRVWEMKLLREGKQVPSYKPISKQEAGARA